MAWKAVEDVSLPVVPQAILDLLNVVYYALVANEYGNCPSYYGRSKTCAIYIGIFVVSFMRRCPNVLSRCEKGNVATIVTARTNASEPKLERMLYYEDTKLRRRRRGIYRR